MNRYKSGKMDLYNLQVKKIRTIHGRIVCDLINGDGSMVLSGNVEWVQRTAHERGYEIENAEEANAQVDALWRQWGVW